LSLARNGVRVAIRLRPAAKANHISAVPAAAGGRQVLVASVTAPPQNGRANEALLRLLSRTWRLPRQALTIIAGASGRNKIVLITGEPRYLLSHLSGLITAPADPGEIGK
jgi:uncharacterized protein